LTDRDVQITLQLMAYPVENGVHEESVERERTVWAIRRSATRAEFYAAEQNGHKATDVFTVYAFEYEGEQRILVPRADGTSEAFDVVRAYQLEKSGQDYLELTAERRRGR